MRAQDRERIQIEVVHRVVDRFVRQAREAPDGYLQTVVNDTLYHERRRLEDENPRSKRTRRDAAFYQHVQRRLGTASETTQRVLIEDIARHFVGEVVGNFDERVYRLTTTIVPHGLSVLLHAANPQHLLNPIGLTTRLDDRLQVQGEVEHLRKLVNRGTVVVVPTHSSNLDSIVLGYAIYLIGLPPLLYGAGINLFTNPITSFFMHNLGAYRVDRKKQSLLYKEVLKSYTTCALEMGYHQLFFPGGTRSRSGEVEQHLKKGLLGTLVRAYVGNLLGHKPKPKIFIVPCTLSYKLVLEAEALITNYLAETGKTSYIIEDDEFSKPRRVLNFFSNIISLNDDITVRVSAPLDIVGNRVDEEGTSLDSRGRAVDTASYVCRDGQPFHDEQRDFEYTNEAAVAIEKRFLSDNVVMSTHVVGRALFGLLRRRNPEIDLYRLLRTGGETPSFSVAEVHAETERLLGRLREIPVKPQLADSLNNDDVPHVVTDALNHFGCYHSRPAAVRRGDRVFHEDRNLIYYYGNRLKHYDLEPRT